MNAVNARDYEPLPQLSLWWLQDPAQPAPIGELRLVLSGRGVSLSYCDAWLAQGVALSEDLPLQRGEFLPERDRAAGAVQDARPDRWGERVIQYLDRPKRLSILEYLLFAGHERFGALGVSVSATQYLPADSAALPPLNELARIHEAIRLIEAGTPVPEALRRLVAPGGSLGGAKPKAVVNIDGQQWVLKFAEHGESLDEPLIEHASLALAQQAGIRAATSRAVALRPERSDSHHAIAVQRFDREQVGGQTRRRHALSADVALRAAGLELGYPQLAQVLRRRAAAETAAAQMAELFRRMVFNLLIDNTDDHEKNHALLLTEAGDYELSPAYDVLPAAQSLGYQQMLVGLNGSESTLDNALSLANQFGLTLAQARAQAGEVARVVDAWREHFAARGVRPADLDTLAAHIDRDALRRQRREALRWT